MSQESPNSPSSEVQKTADNKKDSRANDKKAGRKSSKKILLAVGAVFIVLLVGVGGYFLYVNWDKIMPSSKKSGGKAEIENTKIATAKEPFATYDLKLEDFTPDVPEYSVKSDFSNVYNYKRFGFSSNMKNRLASDYFVVVEGDLSEGDRSREEFFQVYDKNQGEQIPNFITTDSALHSYHLIFDDALKTLEQASFYEKMKSVSESMLKASKEQYDEYKNSGDTDYANAAKRNVAYFVVALKLMGEKVDTPAYVKDIVDSEMKLLNEHSNISCSNVMNLGDVDDPGDCYQEDFSQYVPRGHYTRTERLKKYFKAMMWFGRMTFRQKNASETKSALLLTYSLVEDNSTYQNWSDVYDATSFMVGNSDDLGAYEYDVIMKDIYGENPSLVDLPNESNAEKFMDKIKELRSPAINSMLVWDEDAEEDLDEEIMGFRFMGQRYTLDSDIFQSLIFPAVKKEENGEKRNMPKSLDILAAMGSTNAEEILDDDGDMDFSNYSDQLKKTKSQVSSYTEEDWTANLYWGWLYMMKPLTQEVEEGYPEFMSNDNWAYKDMNTYQGSWTELKHDTILYSKQVYGGLGAGGAVPVPLDERGYVEPRVEVYARLEALAKMTLEGLEDRGLIKEVNYKFTEKKDDCIPTQEECEIEYEFKAEDLRKNLNELVSISSNLKAISVKELKNEKLTDKQYEFIEDYGNRIGDLWFTSLHAPNSGEWESLDENPAMLLADVATDPEKGEVLEEGTGRIMDIYVIIPVSGGDSNYYRVARGAVWSQYEFTSPLSNRLTDEQWISRVRKDDLPDLASWKKKYIFEDKDLVVKSQPMSYEEAIGNWLTLEEAREECESSGGKFENCGSVCKEYEPDCKKPCEHVCRYY